MSDFELVRGFEDAWRPPVRARPRHPETVLSSTMRGAAMRAKLSRLVRRVPEVIVKITGRTRDAAHLRAHLNYITRNGELPAGGRDGWDIAGRQDVRAVGDDWAAACLSDPRRRANSPMSLAVVLSMPTGTDPLRLRDAAGAFAATEFGDGFDYVYAVHTDVDHPHVHLTVRALADDGQRLNPKKADLERWRQGFAQALRDHGIEAEATPRRARGVSRKSERGAVRRMRERARLGRGPLPHVQRQAYREAGRTLVDAAIKPEPWDGAIARRAAKVRAIYLAQAKVLARSDAPEDRRLAAAVVAFVSRLPAPDTQRLALARELRAAGEVVPSRAVDRTRGTRQRGR